VSKRSIVVFAVAGIGAVVLWTCGHALWDMLLAMHGRGPAR
jgi:hypothetical protein